MQGRPAITPVRGRRQRRHIRKGKYPTVSPVQGRGRQLPVLHELGSEYSSQLPPGCTCAKRKRGGGGMRFVYYDYWRGSHVPGALDHSTASKAIASPNRETARILVTCTVRVYTGAFLYNAGHASSMHWRGPWSEGLRGTKPASWGERLPADHRRIGQRSAVTARHVIRPDDISYGYPQPYFAGITKLMAWWPAARTSISVALADKLR